LELRQLAEPGAAETNWWLGNPSNVIVVTCLGGEERQQLANKCTNGYTSENDVETSTEHEEFVSLIDQQLPFPMSVRPRQSTFSSQLQDHDPDLSPFT
jgi:hypothetical protein